MLVFSVVVSYSVLINEVRLQNTRIFMVVSLRLSGYRVKVTERCVCSALVSVTTAIGQMEGVYNFGDFVLCFQDALKAFQMYPHFYDLHICSFMIILKSIL